MGKFPSPLNVPTHRSYTVRYPGRAAVVVSIPHEQLANGDWVRLTPPYPLQWLLMHRKGDNYVPIVPVGSIQDVDAATRTTFFLDIESQLLHIKVVAKPGQPKGELWIPGL